MQIKCFLFQESLMSLIEYVLLPDSSSLELTFKCSLCHFSIECRLKFACRVHYSGLYSLLETPVPIQCLKERWYSTNELLYNWSLCPEIDHKETWFFNFFQDWIILWFLFHQSSPTINFLTCIFNSVSINVY